ncbi:MAG TPA: winged helix DNA-binding domain-containing protein [Thermomicrobiales bacterium]|nr:winged helix DNA-binding domain-containing protein [Thermomicrobiales bacterium]
MSTVSHDVPTLTWDAVVARRLARHGLLAPAAAATPAGVAGAICGAHAQVMSAAELSIALRLPAATRQDVRRALWADHSLVKTFGPRGTVHLLPAADLPMWTAALTAIPGGTRMAPNARMTPEQTEEVIAAIAGALAEAELTVDELGEAVAARTGSWAGDPVMPAFNGMWPRWRQALHTAAHRGALVFGPERGRKVTYTHPRRIAPGFAPANEREAGAWLLRRYLHAYGPATPQQYAKWLSAPSGWATELFASLADELREVTLDGDRAWVNTGDTTMPEAAPTGVRLLPYFDAYGVGSFPRERVFPGRAYERALAGGQAGNYPVLLIDGVAAGVWHQRRSGRTIAITVEPLVDLTAAQRTALDEQVERVGEILEGTPALTIGPVTVGPHA